MSLTHESSMVRWLTGANVADQHAFNVVAGRDSRAMEPSRRQKFARETLPELSWWRSDTRTWNRDRPYLPTGRKYAEALDLKVWMRKWQARCCHDGFLRNWYREPLPLLPRASDDKGLIWPRSISPATSTSSRRARMTLSTRQPEKLAEDLEAGGLRAFYDDRRAALPGVKFKMPSSSVCQTIVVVVGRSGGRRDRD